MLVFDKLLQNQNNHLCIVGVAWQAICTIIMHTFATNYKCYNKIQYFIIRSH